MQRESLLESSVEEPRVREGELEQTVKRMVGSHVREFHLIRLPQGLVLRGRSRTYYAKQLAQQAIMQACGERILANEIEVASRS